MENEILEFLISFGGLFFVLAFVHLVADWVFQSESMAKRKHKDLLVRLKHCLSYCFWFLLIFIILKLNWWIIIVLTLILLVSHFMLDTYKPAIWWLKYVRNPNDIKNYKGKNSEYYLESYIQNNKWLLIMADQIFHLFFIAIIVFIIGAL